MKQVSVDYDVYIFDDLRFRNEQERMDLVVLLSRSQIESTDMHESERGRLTGACYTLSDGQIEADGKNLAQLIQLIRDAYIEFLEKYN